MTDLIEGNVLFCNKESIWISIDSGIIYTQFEDHNKLVPKQSIMIDKNNLKIISFENISEQIPQLIKAICSYCTLYSIEYAQIIPSTIDYNYTILCGVLRISSKIRWGITSKSLTKYTFIPRNKGYPQYIVASKLKPCAIDVYARVEIQQNEKNETNPKGTLVEILGNVDDSSIFEKVILSSYPIFPRNRNSTIRNENKKLSLFDDSESINNYQNIIDEDWSNDMTISIDPTNSQDLDDAISIRNVKDYVEFAVHIATPTLHYDTNSEIEKLAVSQMNSIYTNTKVHHLIPSKLSENKASLRKDKKRICLSVIWSQNSSNVRLVRTLIVNKFEFSYDEVEKNKIYPKFLNLYKSVFNGEEVSNSHELIEKCMIKANSYVAGFLLKKSKHTALLRKSINKNVYYLPNSECNNHEPLGLNYYTHFTSPIRRYADQIVHRQLFDILSNKKPKQLKHETIIQLNLSKLYCQMIESDLNWTSIINKNSKIMFQGKLLYVQDYKARIELIINNKIMKIFIPLISKKIEKLFIIDTVNDDKDHDTLNNTYSLRYLHSNANLIFENNSNINVEIYFCAHQGLDGYKFKWIQPNVEEFLNQFCN